MYRHIALQSKNDINKIKKLSFLQFNYRESIFDGGDRSFYELICVKAVTED